MAAHLVEKNFKRMLLIHEQNYESAVESLECVEKMSHKMSELRVPLRQLRIHLEKLGDTANIWNHWEMIQSVAANCEEDSEDERNTSVTAEGNQVLERQKAIVKNEQKTQNQRKRKHHESSSSVIEKVTLEEFQRGGTLEKPTLAYVTKNDRKGGIRFYVKIDGSIKAMKYKFCKVDGSFYVYCCTQLGFNCEAKHLIRCKQEGLMRYNKSSRIWRLNFTHENIYSPTSFEILNSETCPHTCKELTSGNFKNNDEMSLIPVNLTATDAENTDVESFSLQLPDEKEQVNENENMDTEQGADLSIVIPAKRRKSMRASFRPLLPITAVPNIISEKAPRKSSAGKVAGVPSVDSRLVKVDNNVPKLNESRCILSGECSSCRAVFTSWEELVVHIVEDEDCKKYYVEDNRNYCFICDRPFKVLRTHCHDVLKGKVTYADTKQIKEAHAAYCRIAFRNFRNTEWDGPPETKHRQFGLQGDAVVEVPIDSMNEEQSEVEIQDVTESDQEEKVKSEMKENENDSEMNFGENTADEFGKTNLEDRFELENSASSPGFIEDSFEKPTLEPPGLEDVPILFGETALIKTEWPDLPVSFAT